VELEISFRPSGLRARARARRARSRREMKRAPAGAPK
jgi:hypothetical protein